MAEELGYQKNEIASSLVRQRTRLLGAMLCATHSGFFGEVAMGMQQVAVARGYHLLLTESGDDPELEASSIRSLQSIRVAGLVVQPTHKGELSLYEELRLSGLPMVVFDQDSSAVSPYSVRADESGGVHRMIDHLVGLGHRRIAHLAFNDHNLRGPNLRLLAFHDAMRRHGLEVPAGYVVAAETFEADTAVQATRALLGCVPRPTAIFCAADGYAVMCVNELLRRSLSVPGDISVAGFANQPEAMFSLVPMTTVDQCPRGMGRLAVRRLIARVEGGAVSPLDDELVPTPLIIRGSTGPVCGS